MNATAPPPTTDISHYTYRVTWSVEDHAFVATCLELPSLSCLTPTQVDALTGLERAFSGTFNLRVGEALHRRLAIEAAAEKLSINQLVIRRLNTAS